MSRYRKLLAALGATAAVLASALADGVFTSVETEAIVVSAVGAFFVWLFPNAKPEA